MHFALNYTPLTPDNEGQGIQIENMNWAAATLQAASGFVAAYTPRSEPDQINFNPQGDDVSS